MVKGWLGLPPFEPAEWATFQDIKLWWLDIVHAHLRRRKALATHVMLVSWKIRNERNAESRSSTPLVADMGIPYRVLIITIAGTKSRKE
jgi:hypothetical protein